MRDDVLIVGAGPTGLVLALWLTKSGIKVRIIDKTAGPGTTSRAMLVQARTLELYQPLGLAEAVVAKAQKMRAINMWTEGKHRARLALGAIGEGITPYPYLEVFPQDQHEQLLVERLEALGVSVQRQTELLEFTDHGDHISARVRGPQGNAEAVEARYIVGCDGAHSLVRKTIGSDFPGGTYNHIFYVADVEAEGAAINREAHIDFQQQDFLLIFPIDGQQRVRLIGTISDERAERVDTLTFDDISGGPIQALKLDVKEVHWFSTYRVHHRVADHFREGRAFIAGDAGHVHSPVGGQGMNTGIGDAINLAWKLAAVLRNEAPETLLDSYEPERIPFARRLVQTTDRAFSLATSDGYFAQVVRTRLVPIVLQTAVRLSAVTRFLFRTVSQTMIHYRHSSLSQGAAGRVHGGDRLPWVENNFDSLKAMSWQVHVYGSAPQNLKAWCESCRIPLHLFAWTPKHQAAGLARDAAYLLRPDTYVACAVPGGLVETLDKYLTQQGIRLGDMLK